MAIVKLGQKVKTNLSGALAYTINPAKTDGGDASCTPATAARGTTRGCSPRP